MLGIFEARDENSPVGYPDSCLDGVYDGALLAILDKSILGIKLGKDEGFKDREVGLFDE